jgi:hypothetical protein
MHEKSTLTPKQKKVIKYLADGHTREFAAEKTGVCEDTVYRWLRDHALFKLELSRARDAMFRAGVTQINGHLELAIETLADCAKGEEIDSRQLRAANHLLNHGRAYTELAHLGEKLEFALEQIAQLHELYESQHKQLENPDAGN